MKQLDWLVGARAVPEGDRDDERIRTLGDAWQHAIADVVAELAYCPIG